MLTIPSKLHLYRYMLLVELPLFARSLNLDITMITVMSSVPFFANWIFSVVYSKLLDTARAKVSNTSNCTSNRICLFISEDF